MTASSPYRGNRAPDVSSSCSFTCSRNVVKAFTDYCPHCAAEKKIAKSKKVSRAIRTSKLRRRWQVCCSLLCALTSLLLSRSGIVHTAPPPAGVLLSAVSSSSPEPIWRSSLDAAIL